MCSESVKFDKQTRWSLKRGYCCHILLVVVRADPEYDWFLKMQPPLYSLHQTKKDRLHALFMEKTNCFRKHVGYHYTWVVMCCFNYRKQICISNLNSVPSERHIKICMPFIDLHLPSGILFSGIYCLRSDTMNCVIVWFNVIAFWLFLCNLIEIRK